MASFDTFLYSGRLGQIGTFFCPPWHPRFPNTGPIRGTTIVFPRTSVTITHLGQQPVVGNPNVVMFYNAGQRYTRGKLSDEGDICDWFGFSPQVVIEALRPIDPTVDDRWHSPFVFSNGPSTSALYLQQRMLTGALRSRQPPDLLSIEEMMLAILQQAVQTRYEQKRPSPAKSAATRKCHRELTAAVKAILSLRFRESLSLDWLADSLYTSPFHLCRVFRRESGQTIHSYQNQLRLRASLEQVAAGEVSLMALSMDLGFASHSHFTQAFRRAFGLTPTRLRQEASKTRLLKMSKILTV